MNAPSPTRPAVRTTCPYCGVGCGVLATPDGRGGALIAGDPDHPANFGRLCSKGSALGETLALDTRLLHPVVDGERVSWKQALDATAARLARVISTKGPGAVAFYLSGQLLTEDYYVANKLAKGFIGTGHVDTNSRLCMASSVAGHRRAFGSDTVPGSYADLDEADLLVLVGSNAAWCHPVLFQRMLAARRARGARIITIDPWRTQTADESDLFLPIAPGSDTVLFAHLLATLHARGKVDEGYVGAFTSGFGDALARAREIAPSLEATAAATGLSAFDIDVFTTAFANTERVVTLYSQGVNQSAQGTDKVGAIINCHLATGRIGRPGMGPFSLTGQPNAMGGREVGGLANMLAAHMGYTPEEVDRVRRFWNAPRIVTAEGLKAVQMFEAIERGEIAALWVMGTNPAVSLPRADRVRDALKRLDVLIVSENVADNDTLAAGAGIRLPAHAWSEKDGTVTNSERRISRQRAFARPAGEAKADWWIMAEVARRLGFGDAFAWPSVAAIFREHAALSGFENAGTRDFDISGLAALDEAGYKDLAPVQWPLTQQGARERFFAEGGFYTPDRRARFVRPATPALASPADATHPFTLATGRVRDQWHTMTRTGLSPRLGAHRPVPYVEIGEADAADLSLADGDLARVTSVDGAATLEVRLVPQGRRRVVFAPFHWTAVTSSHGRLGAVVQGPTDPFSGQPEMKATPVAITRVPAAARGFLIATGPVALPAGTWWAKVALEGGTGHLYAADFGPQEAQALAALAFPATERTEFLDPAAGIYRTAAFRDGRLTGALFHGPAAARPHWDALKAVFAGDTLDPTRRRLVLSGKPLDGVSDPGPLVCACFGVGLNVIRDAVSGGTVCDVESIGTALKAGTNCGSCVPELRKILKSALEPA